MSETIRLENLSGSQTQNGNHGVSQGSIPDLILFVIFVNRYFRNIKASRIVLPELCKIWKYNLGYATNYVELERVSLV